MAAMLARVSVLALLTLGSACTSKEPEGGETPRDAMDRFVAAFSASDTEAVKRIVLGSPDQVAALDAMMEFQRVAREFRDAMIASYGEDGWKSFNDKSDARLNIASPADLDLGRATIDVAGPVAHIRIDGAGVTRLDRRRGRWFVALGPYMGADVGRATRMFEATTRCVLEFRARIGAEGETAETIDAAMAPALVLAARTR